MRSLNHQFSVLLVIAALAPACGSKSSSNAASTATPGSGTGASNAAPGVVLHDISAAIAVGNTPGKSGLVDDSFDLDASASGSFASLDAAGNITTATETIKGTGNTTTQVDVQAPLTPYTTVKAGNYLAMALRGTPLMVPPTAELDLDAYGNKECSFAYAPLSGGNLKCIDPSGIPVGQGVFTDPNGGIYIAVGATDRSGIINVKKFDPTSGQLTHIYSGRPDDYFLKVAGNGNFIIGSNGTFHAGGPNGTTLSYTDGWETGVVGNTLVISHGSNVGAGITGLTVINADLSETTVTLPAPPKAANSIYPVAGSSLYSSMTLCTTNTAAYGLSGVYSTTANNWVLTQVYPGTLKDLSQLPGGISACFSAGSLLLVARTNALTLLDPTTGKETSVGSCKIEPNQTLSVTATKMFLSCEDSGGGYVIDLATKTGSAAALTGLTGLK